jgi:hypothetical protein
MSEFKQEMSEFKKEIKADVLRLESFTSDLAKDLSITKDFFNNHVKKDATGIERELKVIIQNHFKDIYHNVKFEELPMKNFYDCSGNLVTEFDYGAFINFYDGQIVNTLIVEAKHSVTKEKIVKKIYQMYKIVQILLELKSNALLPYVCKYEFQKMIQTYNDKSRPLESSIEPNKILLYIGGPNWDTGSFELITRMQSDSDENLMNLSAELIDRYKLKDNGKKLDKEEFFKTLVIMRDTLGAIKPSDDKKYYKVYDRISMKAADGGKMKTVKKHKMINLF